MKRKFSRYQHFQYGCIQFIEHFGGKRFTKKARKRWFKKASIKLQKGAKGKLIEIDRVKNISLKDFRKNYQKKGIPVIFEGAAKDWNCINEWNLNFFKENYGHEMITIVDQNTSELGYERISLSELLDDIDQKGKRYLRFYPFLKKHPERIADFDIEWMRKYKNRINFAEVFQVFIGGKDKYTPIHNACFGNLFVQVEGHKDWVIYPTKYTPVIDPEPARNLYRNAPFKSENGAFNPFEPNFKTPFTLYEYIDGYKARLNPGDVLWNPPYQWHSVKNYSDSIGVSYKWISPFDNLKRAPLYYMLEWFTFKPSRWKSLRLYKKEFNLIHIAESGKLKQYNKEVKREKNKEKFDSKLN